MTYGEFQNVVQSINTGATNPDVIADLTKIVLGKIARRKIRIKNAEISTGGLTEIDLKTTLPDFIDFKIEASTGKPRCIYYMKSGYPIFINLVDSEHFAKYVNGHYAYLDGKTLKISFNDSEDIPATLYFPYYSKYLVLDEDGSTEKIKPENADDEFLLDDLFDDVVLDGVMLYITRSEKENDEYTKAVQEWNKSLNDVILYK